MVFCVCFSILSEFTQVDRRVAELSDYTIGDRETIADEDAELVASWLSGELSAFELLVRKHQKRLLNIAFRITGDYEDACEVVQDSFLAAYRGIASFRRESRFSTWLTSIAINLSRNRLQQAGRHNNFSSVDAPTPGEGGVHHEQRSPAPSPLERLERLDLHEKLEGCIKALASEFREVIVLRDMQDFSYDEMCATLQVREGTIKSRLFRAREAVKGCLKRAVGEL
ncbi:RNA polymerase sigma factor [Geomonas sp.]|uniref:RNA polymerase sigma factor n=1 Tax=Geomonas sp. TaxID=2651584 RepID=UPI002B483E32|nr:RNA polymerase sigma factor [Geomonas sp.]HJV33635.1 RNA polymerase sigma factor [Geomonas sp.]